MESPRYDLRVWVFFSRDKTKWKGFSQLSSFHSGYVRGVGRKGNEEDCVPDFRTGSGPPSVVLHGHLESAGN